eukprot:s10637_g1.t1
MRADFAVAGHVRLEVAGLGEALSAVRISAVEGMLPGVHAEVRVRDVRLHLLVAEVVERIIDRDVGIRLHHEGRGAGGTVLQPDLLVGRVERAAARRRRFQLHEPRTPVGAHLQRREARRGRVLHAHGHGALRRVGGEREILRDVEALGGADDALRAALHLQVGHAARGRDAGAGERPVLGHVHVLCLQCPCGKAVIRQIADSIRPQVQQYANRCPQHAYLPGRSTEGHNVFARRSGESVGTYSRFLVGRRGTGLRCAHHP